MATQRSTTTKGKAAKNTKRAKKEETVLHPKISWMVNPQGMDQTSRLCTCKHIEKVRL